MKYIISLISLFFTLNTFAAKSIASKYPPITYKQMALALGKVLTIKEGLKRDGYPSFTGLSKSKLIGLSMIGEKNDLKQTTLILIFKDNPTKEMTDQAGAAVAMFILSAFPKWGTAGMTWSQSVMQTTKLDKPTLKQRDNKLITVTRKPKSMIFRIDVK